MKAYRRLTEWEASILARLLDAQFRGREQLALQLASAMCRTIDENGSLELRYDGPIRAVVDRRIPVEGEAEDLDGVTIHFLLHVLDSRVEELEIFKEDSTKVRRHMDPRELRLLVLG